MKKKIIIAVALLLLLGLGWHLLYIRGCVRDREGRILVEQDVSSAVWSKNGKALYYVRSIGSGKTYTLCRYDVETRRKRIYHVPYFNDFDVSPDEKSFVLLRGKEILIYKTDKDNAVRVYTTPHSKSLETHNDRPPELHKVCWVSPHKIIFSQISNKSSILMLDYSTGSITPITTIIGTVAKFNTDGSGFIYESGKSYRYYHYDINNRKNILLDQIDEFRVSYDSFVYSSKGIIIYIVCSGKKYSGLAKALNLRTNTTRRISSLQHYSYNMMISPNMTKYWIGYRSHGDWYSEPDKLYTVDIPVKTTRMLNNFTQHK